jgi:hypothetical protein
VNSSSTAVDLTTGAEYNYTPEQFLVWAPSVNRHVNHIHDHNHILVDRIGGSPRRARVTETAERSVLPSPLPLSGHRARVPEQRSGATTGVFSSSAPDPCVIGLPPPSVHYHL